jgi:MFS family permease
LTRIAASLTALRDVGRNRNLRRLELAALFSSAGDWAASVALAVYAYRHGGAAAVGLIALARFGPSAVLAPFLAILADRFDRIRVMVTADLVRLVLLALAALAVAADAAPVLVYGCLIVVALVSPAFAPARAAITPSLATTPEELTAANVVSTTIESSAAFIGPAVGGVLVAVLDPGAVFAIDAATFAWSALLIAGVARVPKAAPEDGHERERIAVLDGFRAILGDARLRVLVGLYTAQTLVCGFLNVFNVVVAIELLRGGPGTLGALDAASGVGGILGTAAAAALVGSRLSRGFALGLVFWSAPLIVVGLAPNRTLALVAMGVLGVANTVVDVAAYTLLQRAVPEDVLGRAFGVVEGLFLGSIGLGAALAPVLLNAMPTRVALVLVGSLLPVLAVVTWSRLAAIDAEAPTPASLAVLRGVPFLAVLPGAALERLASLTVDVAFRAGDVIIREGDVGDRFYVVASGVVEINGAQYGPGESFGEIALLRDVPRTATVTATADGVVVALDREPFVAAVTGSDDASRAAEAIVGARLR